MEDKNRNKRIAKNTAFMYIRMLVLMLISLYSVRIVLKYLGVEDYGIYNLIGGVVVLFSFISNSSGAATQRFLNFAMGKNDVSEVKHIYSASFIIHFIVSVIFLILSEPVGIWAVNNYLQIPSERIFAANWVLQFSLITTVIGILRIPYYASVIAHEKMSFYAIMTIFEGVAKLGIVYLLSVFSYDRLIFYAFLVTIINLITFLIQKIYVNVMFSECKFTLHNDKTIYKELVSFSGWSLLSSVGSTCSNQVLTMIMNRFCGVIANAAMGIANQVNNAVYQLISNFQVAFEPQITKSYASNEREYLLGLIFKTSKFSFFLLWIFVLPLSLNANIVLKVWLIEVPEYSVIFLRIILIYSLIDAIVGPLWMVSYAIGNIRNYQIVAFVMSFVTLPVVWLLFILNFPPYWVVILRVLNNLIFSCWRLGYLRKRMSFPVKEFIRTIIIPSLIVVCITFVSSFGIFFVLNFNVVIQFFISCIVSVIVNVCAIWFIGCKKNEREWISSVIKKIINKIRG